MGRGPQHFWILCPLEWVPWSRWQTHLRGRACGRTLKIKYSSHFGMPWLLSFWGGLSFLLLFGYFTCLVNFLWLFRFMCGLISIFLITIRFLGHLIHMLRSEVYSLSLVPVNIMVKFISADGCLSLLCFFADLRLSFRAPHRMHKKGTFSARKCS